MSKRIIPALLAAVAGIAISAPSLAAGTGSRDIYSDGARMDTRDTYTDGARVGSRDSYTDGARTSQYDSFSQGI